MQRRSFLLTLVAAPVLADTKDESLWRQLQAGGLVVLMRHAATVPGIGDPAGFQLAVCSTQRNLSEAGRKQAERIGAAFRGRQVPVSAVLSSRWCRCLDTAQLAFGKVEPSPMLDSIFTEERDVGRRKLGEVKAFLASFQGKGNIVLVTHDVNIRGLVGLYLEQGEMVVASVQPDGALAVLGVLMASPL